MTRIFCILTAFCLLAAFPARAQDIHDAGAAHLKNLFTQILENQKKAIERVGGTLKTDSDITVEQGKDYYAVTMPAMTYKGVEGEITKIGLIAINVTPTDKKRRMENVDGYSLADFI